MDRDEWTKRILRRSHRRPAESKANGSYYSRRLSGGRLQRCYEIASARVRQYLEAEIGHVVSRLRPGDAVLELGCGYGRVATRLAQAGAWVVGVDTSEESLALARRIAAAESRCSFALMDAVELGVRSRTFDAVVCVQNGISAFGVDRESLLREALRATRPSGVALFSTYSDRFWSHRLAWFEAQSSEGLVGPIDQDASGDGVIVCKDGFRAGRLTPADLESLSSGLGVESTITEVDESCFFCECRPR